MTLFNYVVDPNGGDCYGKYQKMDPPAHIPSEELMEVDDLSDYDVIEWRYDDP